jgi:hypothetical protein
MCSLNILFYFLKFSGKEAKPGLFSQHIASVLNEKIIWIEICSNLESFSTVVNKAMKVTQTGQRLLHYYLEMVVGVSWHMIYPGMFAHLVGFAGSCACSDYPSESRI